MSATGLDLTGVYAKLDRAELHLNALRAEVDTFRKQEPEPFGFRADLKTGPGKSREYTIHAVIRKQPPRTIALLIGDMIQNLRASLDHLIWEMTPKRRQSTRTQFPIFDDECRFKVLSPPMIDGIKGDHRTLIERVQPYMANHRPKEDPLFILGRLSNIDKHRDLLATIVALSDTDTWVSSNNADVSFIPINFGAVDHDAPILRIIAKPQNPAEKMDVYPQSGLEIRLQDAGGIDVIRLAEMLQYHIRHTIIGMYFEYGLMPLAATEIGPPSP